VPAGELGIGTSIVTRAGPSLRLHAADSHRHQSTVYNLEVEDFHTYFVGKAKLWVHNLDCDDLRPGALDEADRWLEVTGERPAVAASMGVEVDGVIRTFKGASRNNNPEWRTNTQVDDLYKQVPAGQHSNYHGDCAEVYILTQMFEAGIDPRGKSLKSFAVNIDKEIPKRHRTGRRACTSCRYVIKEVLGGVDLIGNKLDGKHVGGR